MKQTLTFLKRVFEIFFDVKKNFQRTLEPTYRLLKVEEQDDGKFTIFAQMINKNITVQYAPEEILTDDKLTNSFSPCDIRALTYLGYLGINSPKYKILAKEYCDNNQTIFILQKKGENKIEAKTASEITTDDGIINNLNQKDAHIVGYTMANENFLLKNNKTYLLKQKEEQSNERTLH